MAAASPRSRVDPDVPEEFQGLQGQNVLSEAEVQGLQPPPSMMVNRSPRAAFNVSFFASYEMEKTLTAKNCNMFLPHFLKLHLISKLSL